MNNWEPSQDADQMSQGDIIAYLLETIVANSDVQSFQLAHNRRHEEDTRTGWSISVDGAIIVRSAATPTDALSLALAELSRQRDNKEATSQSYTS